MPTGLTIASTTGIGIDAKGTPQGVHGAGDDVGIVGAGATGVIGTSTSGPSTVQPAKSNAGVIGFGATGVRGTGLGGESYGVVAQGDTFGVLASAGSGVAAVGVYGEATTGVQGMGTATGVWGIATKNGNGIVGSSFGAGSGVQGFSNASGQAGVWGHTDFQGAAGVNASNSSGGFALVTDGDAMVQGWLYVPGNFDATGMKSALVRIRDGEHRRLYCMESPECWFEDFGRARLVRGAARVRLDRTFAQVVRTNDYHVFLSPEGLSHGLYVSRRTRDGFEVREQHQGKSTVSFSYRIVARRKDVEASRFQRVKLPVIPKASRLPKLQTLAAPKPPKLPDQVPPGGLSALLTHARAANPVPRRPGRTKSRGR